MKKAIRLFGSTSSSSAKTIPDDWSDFVYVKEVWWTVDEAQAEVDRLNSLADGKSVGSRYHWQHVRVKRR